MSPATGKGLPLWHIHSDIGEKLSLSILVKKNFFFFKPGLKLILKDSIHFQGGAVNLHC